MHIVDLRRSTTTTAGAGSTHTAGTTPGRPAEWLLPAVEGAMLLTLVVVDPGRIDRPGRWVRALSIAMVVVIAASAAWGSARLVWDLLHGNPQTAVANELLISGALVWAQTVLAFGFLYWELDTGGPVNRHLYPRRHPDLAVSPASRPRPRPVRLATGLRRLPLSGADERHRVQPDGRHAARAG